MPGTFLGELVALAGFGPFKHGAAFETAPNISLPSNTVSEQQPRDQANLSTPLIVLSPIRISESEPSTSSPTTALFPDPTDFNARLNFWSHVAYNPTAVLPDQQQFRKSPTPGSPTTEPAPEAGTGFGTDGVKGGDEEGETFGSSYSPESVLTAEDDWPDTEEDTAVTFDPRENDSAVSGILTVTAVSTPAHGAAALNTDSTITYTPDADYNGPDEFTYTVSDGQGNFAVATVHMYVVPVNDAPVANDDTLTVAEDTEYHIVNVTGNDTDVDSTQLVVTDVTHPANGYAFNENDGTIKYVPNGDFTGTDSFTYTIADMDGGSATATVNVTVTAVGDAPVAYDELFFTQGPSTTETFGAGGTPAGWAGAKDGDFGGENNVFGGGGGPLPISGNVLANDINYDQAYFNTQYNAGLWVTDPRTVTAAYTLTLAANGDFTVTDIQPFTDVSFLVPYTVSNGVSTTTATAHVRIVSAMPPGWIAPTAVEDRFYADARGDSGNVLTNDTAATYAFVTEPPRFSRLDWTNSGSYTIVANAHRTAGDEAFSYQNADGDKKPGGQALAQGKEIKLTLEADSLNLTIPDRTATTAPKKVKAESGARQSYAQKGKPPQAYVHFNVDNDDLRVVKAGEQGVPNGIKPGEAGYIDTSPSLEDFRKESQIDGENDLHKVTAAAAGWDDTTGVAKFSRQNTDMRVWQYGDKSLPLWQWGDTTKSLSTGTTTSITYDLSDNPPVLPPVTNQHIECLRLMAVGFFIEGYGDGKQGQKLSIFSFAYSPPGGQETKIEVEYVFFALNSGRQPTPKERKGEDTRGNFKLIHCEWSITGEPDAQYNCFAYAAGITNAIVSQQFLGAPVLVGNEVILAGTVIVRANGQQVTLTQNVNANRYNMTIDPVKAFGYYKNLSGANAADRRTDTDEQNAKVVLFENDWWMNEKYYASPNIDQGQMFFEPTKLYNSGVKAIVHAAKSTGSKTAGNAIVIYESKLGSDYRIEHVLSQLRGNLYGAPKYYLR